MNKFPGPANLAIVGTSGAKQYQSTVAPPISEKFYTVRKIVCSIDDGCVRWATSEQEYTVYIEINEFASGKTKHAYKLRLDGIIYAAKSFYNTTSDTPGSTCPDVGKIENKKHIKDELVRQTLAQVCLTQFQGAAKSKKISIFDIKIATSFILEVVPNGICWLVDRYLNIIDERKFSGTQRAGSSSDLSGRTCDALAHFSFHDSQKTFVLDIDSGILTPAMHDGQEMRSKELVLFDLMAHSADGLKGLGNMGQIGISQFIQQHICNDIYKKLGLPDPKLVGADTDDDSEGEDEKPLVVGYSSTSGTSK